MGDGLWRKGEFHDQLNRLMHVMTEVVDVKVLKNKPTSYTKCWWFQELTDSHWEVWRLA